MMAGEEFSRLTDEKGAPGSEPIARRKGGSPTCYRNTLICVTILFIGVGIIVMGIAVHGKQHIHLITLPALSGITASGILLVIVSIVGLYGALRHNQIFLFVYIVATAVLFLLLICFSIAVLSIGKMTQHNVIKEAWNKSSVAERDSIQRTFDCCGLEHGGAWDYWCHVGTPQETNTTIPCFDSLKEPVARAVSASGGVGLFFALTLGVGAYVAVMYRKQMREPTVVEGDVLL